MRRKIFIIWGIIFLLALIIGGTFLFLRKRSVPKPEPLPPPMEVEKKKVTKPIFKTGLEIAQASLAFLDKSFDPDWRMVNYLWECAGSGNSAQCKNRGLKFHHTAWYGGAYAHMWNRVRNDTYLQKARHIFEGRILNPDAVGTLEECFTEDTNFIAELTTKGGNYRGPQVECVDSYLGHDDWVHLTEENSELPDSKEGRLAIRKAGNYLLEVGKPITGEPFSYLDAKNLANLFHMTHDQEKKYLEEAKRRLAMDRETLSSKKDVIYYGKGQEPFRAHRCWLDWGLSELYRNTKDSSFREELESMMQKLEISKHVEDLEETSVIATCAAALKNLSQDTSNPQYKDEAVSLMEYLVQNFWDSEFLPKYNGDNGFLTLTYVNGTKNTKFSLWTAYIIRILASDFAFENFKIGEVIETE